MFGAEGPRHTPGTAEPHSPNADVRVRAFRISWMVVRSYISGPNRLRHAHMRRTRLSISSEKSAFLLILTPRYEMGRRLLFLACCYDAERWCEGCVVRCLWEHCLQVLFSDTVMRDASKTVIRIVTIFPSLSSDLEAIHASTAYNMRHTLPLARMPTDADRLFRLLSHQRFEPNPRRLFRL